MDLRIESLNPRCAFELARASRSVGQLTETLEPWLAARDVPEPVRRSAQICCDEIMANVIRHAGAVPGPVRVEVTVEAHCVAVKFVYRARHFDPAAHTRPDTHTPVSQRESGGLGLLIVQQLSSRFEFKDDHGEHHLRFELAVPAQSVDCA